MSETLADAIVRDILTERPRSRDAQTCFVCARPYSKGDGRFCSRKCRTAFDAGLSPVEPSRISDGIRRECCGCHREFVSRGLRCCSPACERTFVDRDANTATMAEVGMDLPAKRKCQSCGGDIPRYVGTGKKRRLTKKTVVFCSPRCTRKGAKAPEGLNAVNVAISAQKPLRHKGSGYLVVAGTVPFCADCGGRNS
jgi:hypothetical protein